MFISGYNFDKYFNVLKKGLKIMTYLEKLKLDYPQIPYPSDYVESFMQCPDYYGYISTENNDAYCQTHDCDECWNREMPVLRKD